MRITVWLASRDRITLIAAAEVLLLALLLFAGSPGLRVWLGLPLLGHLGYRALTSLPIGQIPGKPNGVARQRRNQDLRTRVVAFLNEVRRVESYAAKNGGEPDMEANLEAGRLRMMNAAAEVARVAGRFGLGFEGPRRRGRAARSF